MSGLLRTDMVSVTVHGPAGALDLMVPAGAAVTDLVREYATAARTPHPLQLLDGAGTPVPDGVSVEAAGIQPGSVLVATPAGTPPPPPVRRPDGLRAVHRDAVVPWVLAGAAGVLAVVGAVVAAGAGGPGGTATAVLLAVAAIVSVLPFGAHADQRALVAPAFAGSAVFVVLHAPGAAQLPVTVGTAALVAGTVAAVARALGADHREALDVWTVTGVAWFVVTAVPTFAGAEPQVAWSLVVVVALLAGRLVPRVAVDVPDRMLVDLDGFAVSAWVAREARGAEPARVEVDHVEAVLRRGGRWVDAGAVAAAASLLLAAPQVAVTAVLGVDRWGGAVLLAAAGLGLFLASRDLRHRRARGALRAGGAVALLAGGVPHLAALPTGWLPWVLVLVVLLASGLTAAAVATGRGWRSVHWSRRAETAEVVVVATALAAAIVASGWFRMVWEFRA